MVALSTTPDDSPIISDGGDTDAGKRKPRHFSKITSDVKARIAGQWRDILATEGGIPGDSLDGEHHPCPKCGGTDRFRLIDADAGAVFCNQCFSSGNGDGFAALQWALGIDFKDAVLRLAGRFNIPTDEPKKSKAKKTRPAFERMRDELQDDIIGIYCYKKPPQTVEAVKAAGGIAVNWPIGYLGDQRCIAFPAYDDCGKVTGHILRRVVGNDFAAYKKTAASKTRMIKGSKDGLVIPGGAERLKAATVVWKCEGVPDAVTLFAHLPDDHSVISNICGAKAVPPYLDLLAGKIVYIVGDRDKPGQDGAKRWANKLAGIAAEVRMVDLPFPMTDDAGKDLRDYFLEGGTFAGLLALAEAANVWTPTEADAEQTSEGNRRTDILLTTHEYEINNAVIAAIATDDGLYQRGGQLVTVIQGVKPDVFTACSDDVPRAVGIPLPGVRETIAKHVNFYVEVKTDGGIENVPKHVPDWSARAVHARGMWESVRPLRGIINHPVLTPDGSVLTKPGYDPQTGLIVHWPGEPLAISSNPTKADAVAAVGRLKDLVADFPFESEGYRAGWLAFLLTVFIRYAFRHVITSPLFLIDANVRGSGKSKLADLVGLIVCGFELARMILPRDDDELRKSMLAIALAGDEIVLIDNVADELGGQTLDAVLTGTQIRGRILGESREVAVDLNTVFAATSNNAAVVGDTCRRTIPIRLLSPLENPEERTGFRIPNILQHARQHRAELLADALTILRAYCVAGRPDVKLSAMGSFEDWSSLVRAPLVWIGEPDPWETRIEFAKRADSGAHVLGDIFRHWQTVDPDNNGVTVTDLMQRLESNPHYHAGLRGAVSDLCNCKPGKPPTPKTLGRRLGAIRDRVYQGQRLVSNPNRTGVMVWRVEVVNRQPASAGFAGIAGFVSATSRGKVGTDDSEHDVDEKENTESIRGRAETNPANHANPATVVAHPTVAAVPDAEPPRMMRADAPPYPWAAKPAEGAA